MTRVYTSTSKVAVRLRVDLADEDLNRFCWRLSSNGYAIRGPMRAPDGSRPRFSAHRVVLERKIGRPLAVGEFADHINGDKLDNRRENLRVASKSTNAMNSRLRTDGLSPYRGVYRTKDRWVSYIDVQRVRLWIYRGDSELEAAWMRDQWALALHGEFASLNFDYQPVENSADIAS